MNIWSVFVCMCTYPMHGEHCDILCVYLQSDMIRQHHAHEVVREDLQREISNKDVELLDKSGQIASLRLDLSRAREEPETAKRRLQVSTSNLETKENGAILCIFPQQETLAKRITKRALNEFRVCVTEESIKCKRSSPMASLADDSGNSSDVDVITGCPIKQRAVGEATIIRQWVSTAISSLSPPSVMMMIITWKCILACAEYSEDKPTESAHEDSDSDTSDLPEITLGIHDEDTIELPDIEPPNNIPPG